MGVWKHALATTASGMVLVVGFAVPDTGVQLPDNEVATAAARVASAAAAAEEDERRALAERGLVVTSATELLEHERAATAREAELAAAAAQAAADQAAKEAAEQAAAAAARAAAAQAAAEAAAQAAHRTATTTRPAPPKAPAPPAGPPVAWSTRVVNSGGQDAVNRCQGGLTHWYQNVDGKPYYPIHRRCGGTPLLGLHLGDRVQIDGALWVVTDTRDVPNPAHYSAAAGMSGQILLQTCYADDRTMRLLALNPA